MCGGNKPSSQQQSSTTYSPPAAVMQEYTNVTNQANQVAATPYNPYGGQLVAPINSEQSTGIGGINAANGIQNPYNAASGAYAVGSTSTLTPSSYFGSSGVNAYYSPYQQDVVNATQAQFNNQNAQQSSALLGQGIASGNAFGGDREGIAQSVLAGQQQTAEAPVIAGLENTGFTNAQNEFNTQQQTELSAEQQNNANKLAASQALSGLGSTAQGEAINEATAQTNAGTLQQQTQQAQDTATYNQYLQQLAYPFQTTGWLANIAEGIGSQSGGTSSGVSSTESNNTSGLIGAGLGLLSFLARGGAARPERASGGGIGGAVGSMDPWSLDMVSGQVAPGAGGIVPAINLPIGNTMPKGQTPNSPQQQQSSTGGLPSIQSGLQGLSNSSLGDSVSDFMQDTFGFKKGGGVAGGMYRDKHGVHGGIFRPRFDDGGNVSEAIDDNLFNTATGSSPFGGLSAVGLDPAAQPVVGSPSAGLAAAMQGVQPNGVGTVQPNSNMGFNLEPNTGVGMANPSGVAPTPPDRGSPYGAIQTASFAPDQSTPTDIEPRNVRNNNPGNLIDNSWTQSQPGYSGSDGHFAVFNSPQAGAAAMDHNLVGYAKQGLTTPLQIISKWAPAGDNNNPVAYASKVAKDLGVGINDPLNMADPTVRQKLATSMASFEGGISSDRAARLVGGQNGAAPSDALAFGDQPRGGVAPAVAAINKAAPALGITSGGDSASPGVGGAPQGGTDFLSRLFGSGSNGAGQGRTGLIGLNLSDQERMGLLAAGLGIMSGKSLNPWQNIGAGGLEGLESMRGAAGTTADVALKQAQAARTMTETQLQEYQLKKLMLGLEQYQKMNAAHAGNVSDAASDPNRPAPTATEAIGVSPPKTPIAAPNVVDQPNASAPAVSRTAPRQPIQEDDPNFLLDRAKAANLGGLPFEQDMAKAKAIMSGEMPVRYTDGTTGVYGQSEKVAKAAAQAGAEAGAKVPYETAEVQPTPGGPTYTVPKSQVLNGGVGAGSPPGSAANEAAAANPAIAKQPAFYAERQSQIAKNEDEMIQKMQARQLSRQRLQALKGIMQNYQPGAFASEKANIVGALRGVGIDVPDTATANPTAFQEFMKNATANVFNDVKGMGGRVLVSEIEGLTKANANPELQPGAAAAIIGQGLGVLDYEDKHTKDYFDWKHQNPNAYDTSTFEIPWMQKHQVGDFVDKETKGISYKGQVVPAKPEERTVGQTYLTPRGPMTWRGNGWQPAGASP